MTGMPASLTALAALHLEQPEWSPWLRVLEEIVREPASAWDVVVASGVNPSQQATAPVLAGSTVSIPPASIRGLVKRLIRAAENGGTPKMRTLQAVRAADLDVLTLFAASVGQDRGRLEEIAGVYRADAEAFEAVMALVAVPFLHACRRRWAASLPPAWTDGFCPLCGSWPAFAEMRGIERSRHFRCGRCASEWHSRLLCCPYCASTNHDELVTLVPEKTGASCAVDACKRCLGYVKTLTRLQGCPPDAVLLEDLATVAFDVAALEQGYSRPAGPACPLGPIVTESRQPRRFFAWNT
jgi:FdhE protein